MHACIGEGNGNPLQYPCLENPSDRGAWWAAIYGVIQSQTWLKRLSSSSRSKELKEARGKHWTICSGGTCLKCNLFLKKEKRTKKKEREEGNTQQLHLVNEADPGSSWNSLWCILPRNAVPNKEGLSPVCSRGTCWRWYLGGTGCNFEKIVACCKRHIFRDGRRPANRIREDEWRGREYKELSYEPFHRLPWNCPFVFCRQPTKALLASLEIDC